MTGARPDTRWIDGLKRAVSVTVDVKQLIPAINCGDFKHAYLCPHICTRI